ncbi:MAG TPA: dienelactone hydrolase family protein, partial [Fimbriimonas sp.]|nr:dienelactone hydrolase family protein [Fimbriimonas sp.]
MMFVATLLALNLGSDISYKIGSEDFVGYGAKPASWSEGKPVVYVIQDWDGVNAHEKEVVENLAAEGYAAFAIDIYGKNNRPKTMADNGKEAGKYYANPTLFMERITEGM